VERRSREKGMKKGVYNIGEEEKRNNGIGKKKDKTAK